MRRIFGRLMTQPAAPPAISVFTFTKTGPLPTLHFPLPLPSQTTFPRKRFRPVTDVDGEHSSGDGKKKRRLRRFLITSRLSLPFSQPATNIVDRGSSKIAVWAKQRSLGRNLLRKAAIMNRIRHKEAEVQNASMLPTASQNQMEMVRQTFMYGAPDTLTHPVVRTEQTRHVARNSPNFTHPPALLRGPNVSRDTSEQKPTSPNRHPSGPSPHVPRRDYIPLPPSPLGLSNYDAFDLEDDFHDEDDDDGGCDWSAATGPQSSSPYSDFDALEPAESVVDDYDSIEAFASPETRVLMDGLDERMRNADIEKEQLRQRDFTFVRFGH